MILVIGATGPVGSQVVGQLVERGADVRALTRDPKGARFSSAVEVVGGDLGKPETLADAFAGVDRVFMLMPTFGAPETRTYDGHVADAASRSGVSHLVRLSVIAAADDSADDPHTDYHRHGEQVVRDSGVGWTFLRPGQFMTNALSWAETIKEGYVREPYAHVKQTPIDPRDIAASAVAVLTSDGHEGEAYSLSGPDAISIEEQVAIIAEVTGRTIRTINVPPGVARAEWLNEGYPAGMVDGIMKHMADETGIHSQLFGTVAELTGRPAHTFAEWAEDNIEAFR
ncbi:Uncharacterized conserved protein YbjT, contains NAD(P)-binding and DUF2867 domains [Saccharopolyspora shandongensis]|uniref:Uncharacterized conserved protein YbjT, contains NAD(P)-binding and DUF2867 domains n=1 Tax=Saccharopolyspora shandongensis TaxID=418495 RepID=A0A1H2QPM3_9PSEU|nr:NAD(P)H-binding protein [Saccharopolyspora shandongensis]SDW09081.1 Uncharacterized conserved protein YbjT, contains NAD(P)-binding and DUF2867 domains [Saccharopolyspora shandongensis]